MVIFTIKRILKNEKGEVYASTAVKIIISVVLGSALLVGLTTITSNTYLPKIQLEVDSGLNRTHIVDLDEAEKTYASWKTRLDDKFQKEITSRENGYEAMAGALKNYAYKYDPNPTNTGCNIDNYIYCTYNINQESKGKQTLTQEEFEHLKKTPEGKLEIMEVVDRDA